MSEVSTADNANNTSNVINVSFNPNVSTHDLNTVNIIQDQENVIFGDNKTTRFEDIFSEEIWRITYKDYKDHSVDDTLYRVARAVASVEDSESSRRLWTENFYDMLTNFKVVPGGRILANAGTDFNGTTLLNCFVGGNAKYDTDSIEGIYKVLLEQSLTLKSEGGWGKSFNFIRPRGTFIEGVGVETPGAVKFMEMFDKSSEIITAGSGLKTENKKAKGKIRKGAMLASLSVWHPDVIEFITAKQTPGRLTKFNISVDFTDEFMKKLTKVYDLKEAGASQEEIDEVDSWDLIYPITSFEKYKAEWKGDIQEWLSKGYPVKTYRTISTVWLWNLVMESTYNRAEPGVLFLDRANTLYPANYASKISSTNPCGEQVLPEYGVCLLSSLNLTQFLNYDSTDFDYEKVRNYTKIAIRFLDDVNDLTRTPLEQYQEFLRTHRRVGLGIMGWGSALYMMKIRFGSDKATQIRDKLMKTITHTGIEASIELAEEKGMFPYCQPEKHAQSPFFSQIELPEPLLERMKKSGIRNSSLFSIQPTGSSSIFANITSGGLEPIFMPEYIRTTIVPIVPDEIRDACPKYWEGAFHETEMFKTVKEGDEEILRGVAPDGTVYKIDRNRGLTKEVLCEDYGVRWLKQHHAWDAKADWAVSTTELSVDDHVNDLKGFSKYLDSACSKTINLPYDYPLDDFKNVYLDAYRTGYIKGLTTYRSGTMTTVLSAKEEKDALPEDEEIILENVKLPDSSPATVKKIKCEGKKWYLTVILDEEQKRPFALFVQTNSVEKNVLAEGAIESLISLARAKGIPERHVADVEVKMSGEANAIKIARVVSLLLRHGVLIKNIVKTLDSLDVPVSSFVFQIKKYLSQYVKDGEKVHGSTCESCGSTQIVFSEGCFKCNSCGSSKC